VEETTDDDETWGKTTTRPRRLATWKESPNGGVKWQLADGEWAVAAYHSVGEKLQKGGGSFLYAEERECAVTGPHVNVRCWRQAGPVGTRRGNGSFVLVRLARMHGWFEDDSDNCSVGPGPIRSNKSFSVIQACSDL
jgi:hypothetical protein